MNLSNYNTIDKYQVNAQKLSMVKIKMMNHLLKE